MNPSLCNEGSHMCLSKNTAMEISLLLLMGHRHVAGQLNHAGFQGNFQQMNDLFSNKNKI